jgi:elongation factor P--(R)-beta-lysine ligase
VWRPAATLATLRLRAELLSRIRAFFAARGVLEVDTPALSASTIPDPNIHSFATRYQGPGPRHGAALYLHTSPEFPMKRLLAAGSGDIYQIARVFRDGEAGRRHNPEFTLLEWYRVGWDHHRLMDEVASLVGELLPESARQPAWRFSYRELFRRHLDLDPFRASVAELIACAETQGVVAPTGLTNDAPDPWLDLLLTHCIEPRLPPERLVFVHDYPSTQAALARIRPDDPPVAERFELYLGGIELANGFHELADPVEQRCRFERDNRLRAERGLPPIPLDEQLLAALEHLPDCAGVALGVDRLLMLAAGKRQLDEVLAFPFERA